jgi:hypothetical protein
VAAALKSPAAAADIRCMRRPFAPLLLCALLLPGCDQLGIESPATVTARKEADGKAVGGACRHAGRAIEDCYTLNKKADKAAMYAGWREMSEYMRENKLDPVAPVIPPEAPPPPKAASAPPPDGEAADEPTDEKAAAKPAAKSKAH